LARWSSPVLRFEAEQNDGRSSAHVSRLASEYAAHWVTIEQETPEVELQVSWRPSTHLSRRVGLQQGIGDETATTGSHGTSDWVNSVINCIFWRFQGRKLLPNDHRLDTDIWHEQKTEQGDPKTPDQGSRISEGSEYSPSITEIPLRCVLSPTTGEFSEQGGRSQICFWTDSRIRIDSLWNRV
jgi:hypothetical protein